MARRKLSCREGDWFAVPLSCGGYALGLLARMSKQGILLAYFFRPRFEDLPTIEQIGHREAKDAIMVEQVGPLGFIKGTWKVVGRLEPWTPSDWPVPVFGRHHELMGKAWAWRVFYSENLDVLCEEPASVEEVRDLPQSGLAGHGFAEERLSMLLCGAPG